MAQMPPLSRQPQGEAGLFDQAGKKKSTPSDLLSKSTGGAADYPQRRLAGDGKQQFGRARPIRKSESLRQGRSKCRECERSANCRPRGQVNR
jgi:hypothetical protein